MQLSYILEEAHPKEQCNIGASRNSISKPQNPFPLSCLVFCRGDGVQCRLLIKQQKADMAKV